LNVARSVIDHNPNRTQKNLFSDRGSGDKIVYYEAEDDRMEARYVVETISKLIENGNVFYIGPMLNPGSWKMHFYIAECLIGWSVHNAFTVDEK